METITTPGFASRRLHPPILREVRPCLVCNEFECRCDADYEFHRNRRNAEQERADEREEDIDLLRQAERA
jgi:hypothetical protein